MSLNAARCTGCSQLLADAPYTTVRVYCAFCRREHAISISADGQRVDFEAKFSPQRLGDWFRGARAATLASDVGVAVGACEKCAAPLVIPRAAEVALACPHCELRIAGPAEKILYDLWTEPYASVESGKDSQLEFKLALALASHQQSAGCAHCTGATPPHDESVKCRFCGSTAWFQANGERAQFGVQIEGTAYGRPYENFVNLTEGESHLRGSSRLEASVASGNQTVKYVGIGCLGLFAFTLLITLVTYLFISH